MYYLIYVTTDVPNLGIAADSEFELPAYGKGERTLAEYVEAELGLKAGQYFLA